MVFQRGSNITAWWHVPLPDIPSDWHYSSFQNIDSARLMLQSHGQYSTNTNITGIYVECDQRYQHQVQT